MFLSAQYQCIVPLRSTHFLAIEIWFYTSSAASDLLVREVDFLSAHMTIDLVHLIQASHSYMWTPIPNPPPGPEGLVGPLINTTIGNDKFLWFETYPCNGSASERSGDERDRIARATYYDLIILLTGLKTLMLNKYQTEEKISLFGTFVQYTGEGSELSPFDEVTDLGFISAVNVEGSEIYRPTQRFELVPKCANLTNNAVENTS